jgi:hypothetical protein
MRKFIATMSYELSADTSPDARKLLRAELVGRRWKDMVRDRRMPRQTLWIQRSAEDDQTTSDLHDLCADELRAAARAVRASGRSIRVLRAFIQVAGGGTHGLAPEGYFDEPDDAAP